MSNTVKVGPFRSTPIPGEALAQHIIALGKTGSGKSSKLRVLVEQLLEDEKPVCILDPKGDWWGLKSSADGKRSGYPIVIFGGEHADVPLNAHAGSHVAELVATGNRSCLIDLGGWMVGDRTRFFIDFASTLFKLTRGSRHLVIDEVHNFAPQGKILDVDAGRMLHWANRLASEGRGKGLTIIAASQRPQKVHKDFLTSCETLIACKVIHKLDRDSIKDWIDGCADPAKGREVLASLAGMKKPEAWCWSPEIDFGPELVSFPMFRTYDSFKPQAADAGKLAGWAAVDLDQVKAKLASVVEEAKKNDPAELRRRIAELEKQVKGQTPVGDAPRGYSKEHLNEACNRAENEGYRRGFQAGSETAGVLITTMKREIEDAIASFVLSGTRDLQAKVNAAHKSAIAKSHRFKEPAVAGVDARRIDPAPSRPVTASLPEAGHAGGSSCLPKAERALLTVLAQHSAGRTRVQLALLSGYSSNSSSFANAIGALRSAGLIDRGDPMRITAAGFAAIGNVDPLPSGEQLRQYWLGRLDKAERALLTCVLDAWPGAIERDELARKSGYSANSSSFANALGKLRTLELVQRGEIRAAEVLFE